MGDLVTDTMMQETSLTLPLDRRIGLRMRLRRRALGLSQNDLAQKTQMTSRRVSLCEQGVRPISAGELYEMACCLRVSVTYFYDTAPLASEVDALLDEDPVRRLETENFVQAFYSMKNPTLQRDLLKLIGAAARSKDGFE